MNINLFYNQSNNPKQNQQSKNLNNVPSSTKSLNEFKQNYPTPIADNSHLFITEKFKSSSDKFFSKIDSNKINSYVRNIDTKEEAKQPTSSNSLQYSDIDQIIQKFLKKPDSPTNSNKPLSTNSNINLMSKTLEKKKLDNITKKAAEYVDQCKKTNEDLYIIITEYNKKKEKLKIFAKKLNNFNKEVKQKEEQLEKKEREMNELEIYLNNEAIDLKEKKRKFKNFVEIKSQELKEKANEVCVDFEKFRNCENILKHKSEEIENRLEYVNKVEEELKILFDQFQLDKSHIEQEKIEFNFMKNEFEIYSEEVIKKYSETKIIQNDLHKKEAKIEILQSELNSKEQNIKLTSRKYEDENKIFSQKKEELEKKISEIIEKESLVHKSKLETDEKLKELSIELVETRRLNKILKDKEVIFKIKHNIDKDLDLKLSEIELSESLSKKKMAMQEKMLNEEILKKLNNTLISQSKFYK